MVICSCDLPACCCKPVVAGSIIYADPWGKLNTHLALQALFTHSLCAMPLLQAFPFRSTVGRWHCIHFLRPLFLFTVHMGSGSSPLSSGVFLPPPLLQAFLLLIAGHVQLLLPASLFVYSSRGMWVFPPLLWSFLPSATLTSFPAPGCWAHAPAPALSGQAQLVYLQFWKGFPSPLFCTQVAPPSCNMSYCSYCLLLSFSFSPGWGVSRSRGLYWSGPGLSVEVPCTS
jgi:hypothetical protein